MSTSNLYASRKRRKPSQKSLKPSSTEGVKSNPSKRHRERLNGELDRLASLLPFHQDVISKLDKLTILRLSVGYLRVKSHFSAALNSNTFIQLPNNCTKAQVQELPEGELLLQVINGFALVVTAAGTVFYASSSVQDHLGFHQSDIVHQSVYELIHSEDRAEFRRQLDWALNPATSTDTGTLEQATQDSQLPLTYYNPEQIPPENSPFLERNFICRLRCLLNNSSGFLAMNFQGRLKFLHGQKERMAEGKLIPPQLALFALASPVQPPSILEIRARNFIFKTKHKLDFTPMACDAKGKTVLGYTEEEMCYHGSGYQYIHAADMLYCAENHIRMIKTGESGLTAFRLLTKLNGWVWVQANARLIYKNGHPDFIIASQKVLTEEEGEENLRKRSLMLPFGFTTGEAVLYDFSLPMSLSGSSSDSNTPGNSNQTSPSELDPNSLLGSMLKQDKSIYVCPTDPNEPQGCAQEPDEDEPGGIFSSNLLENLLSEHSLFIQEPASHCGREESGCELLSFMGSLGISPEDLQLLQQDEMFLNVGFDLSDSVLSYVQESLRRKADCVLSSSVQANLEEKYLLSSDTQTLTSSLFPVQGHSQQASSLIPASSTAQSQQQHLPFLDPSEPKQLIHMQSYSQSQQSHSIQEHRQNPQGYLYQPQSLPCPEPYGLSKVTLQGQSVSLQPGYSLNAQQQLSYPVNQNCVQKPEPVYHGLNHIQQGTSSSTICAPGSITTDQQLPAVFQPGLEEPGRFFLETTTLGLELPYRNQLNTVSANCNQEFPCSYIPTGDTRVDEFNAQDLEDLLNSLDGVGQQKRGQPGEVQREEWCPRKPAGEL